MCMYLELLLILTVEKSLVTEAQKFQDKRGRTEERGTLPLVTGTWSHPQYPPTLSLSHHFSLSLSALFICLFGYCISCHKNITPTKSFSIPKISQSQRRYFGERESQIFLLGFPRFEVLCFVGCFRLKTGIYICELSEFFSIFFPSETNKLDFCYNFFLFEDLLFYGVKIEF